MAQLIVVTAPAVEVVTVDEAKINARVEIDDEDHWFERRITMAREQCERLTERAIGAQTLQYRVDGWPRSIVLPRPPLTAVVSVKYLDGLGVEQTLSTSAYYTSQSDSQASIEWYPGTTLPTLADRRDTVRVNYTAGYTPSTCPLIIKAWIEMAVARMYEHRELSAERIAAEHPWTEHMLSVVSEIGY